MTVAQDIGAKWQTAYNNGDATKIADLYTEDAVWVRPTEIDKGKVEIEKAVATLMKLFPKLTAEIAGAYQHGNVLFFYTNYTFSNGPAGHSGITLVNDAGVWRIAMHASANTTPPKQ
jgi:uncharacterized protein (TIGR02246 family)